MKHFNELTLPSALARAISKQGWETPTPVQAEALPPALAGRDIIACAQTGSGKTAAFALPILTRFMNGGTGAPAQLGQASAQTSPHSANLNAPLNQSAAKPAQMHATPNAALSPSRPLLQPPAANGMRETALVLAPTRELATQIAQTFESLARELGPQGHGLMPVVLMGGVSMSPQTRALSRRPRIIIATPGRLIDHMRQRTVSLQTTAVLVLDEADRMLDMGFAAQLDEILRALPRPRQTMLFSATLPDQIRKLAERQLRDPARVAIQSTKQSAPQITQSVRSIDSKSKNGALLDELNAREGSVLVFARTQHRTDRVARYLESYGIDVARIHGGRTQGQRTRALEVFKSGDVRVLVATDIAARGIHVDHVAHVINYDLPQVPEDYVHRIGRTGRAGKSGEAVAFVAPEDRGQWREIERCMGISLKPTPLAQAPQQSHATQGRSSQPSLSRPIQNTSSRSAQPQRPAPIRPALILGSR